MLFRRDFSGAKKVEIVHFKEGEEGGNWGHEVEDVVDLDFDPLFEVLLHIIDLIEVGFFFSIFFLPFSFLFL